MTGVAGGEPSRTELELARDSERARDAEDAAERELERRSELERALCSPSPSGTRGGTVVSAVRNWRIWSLRLLRSSRVIPSVWRSWEMGDTWVSVIGRRGYWAEAGGHWGYVQLGSLEPPGTGTSGGEKKTGDGGVEWGRRCRRRWGREEGELC